MKEWMDLYDCQGRVKGLVHTTTQAPQDGNFYLATRIWVRDAAGAFLFLRCADTDSWTPGQWTVPGDFVAAGVQGPDAARQALQAQTGLTPADAQWQSLGSQRYRDSHNGVPYHAIAQLYLVQLPETAPANVVLGEAVQTCQWDIDRNGRLKADASGELYFENAPGEKVRLRGFNFVSGSWEDRFYTFTKAEIEEFAEQIRLAGMNILRFHFLDGALAGVNGLPKQGKDRKDIAEIHIPQSVDELKIDSAFAERYYYLLKCLRERGVYVMLDIFTSRGLMTGAVNAKDYPRFQMFDNPVYQKHWKTAFDFLLKKPNPYTGKALIDDPQLIGITFFNEQEHLFNPNSPENKRFTTEWREVRGASAPEFNFTLLRSDSPDGAAAREFLRGKIRKMNEFYLGVVRESGFKGFVTNWDM